MNRAAARADVAGQVVALGDEDRHGLAAMGAEVHEPLTANR
jgi:hypothetical protein